MVVVVAEDDDCGGGGGVVMLLFSSLSLSLSLCRICSALTRIGRKEACLGFQKILRFFPILKKERENKLQLSARLLHYTREKKKKKKKKEKRTARARRWRRRCFR